MHVSFLAGGSGLYLDFIKKLDRWKCEPLSSLEI